MALFSDPKKNIDQCGIQSGMVIADFGAGSGFYTIEAARALGATGKVYAVDAQKDLLVRLAEHAHSENLMNVDVIWGDIEKMGGTKIADSSIDLVLVCNVLFQLEDKKTCLSEIKRVLTPGGRMLFVDWMESFGGIGPQSKDIITAAAAEKLCTAAGFAKEREISAGAHHYGFIFKKL